MKVHVQQIKKIQTDITYQFSAGEQAIKRMHVKDVFIDKHAAGYVIGNYCSNLKRIEKLFPKHFCCRIEKPKLGQVQNEKCRFMVRSNSIIMLNELERQLHISENRLRKIK